VAATMSAGFAAWHAGTCGLNARGACSCCRVGLFAGAGAALSASTAAQRRLQGGASAPLARRLLPAFVPGGRFSEAFTVKERLPRTPCAPRLRVLTITRTAVMAASYRWACLFSLFSAARARPSFACWLVLL
jgi:hypothetical protein